MKTINTIAMTLVVFAMPMVGSTAAFGQLADEEEALLDDVERRIIVDSEGPVDGVEPRIVVDGEVPVDSVEPRIVVDGEVPVDGVEPRIVVDGEEPIDGDVDSEAPDILD